METIQSNYEFFCETDSDINQHLPILKEYSKKCQHVTEFGFRNGVSIYAFLSANPKRVVSYDINYNENVDRVTALSKAENINFEFIQKNVLEADIENTDLLFIDTWHVAEQCKKELELHAGKVNKYLIFHDIFTFGENGEDGVVGNGLLHAINPFIKSHPEWKEVYMTTNNNGLLILEKCT